MNLFIFLRKLFQFYFWVKSIFIQIVVQNIDKLINSKCRFLLECLPCYLLYIIIKICCQFPLFGLKGFTLKELDWKGCINHQPNLLPNCYWRGVRRRACFIDTRSNKKTNSEVKKTKIKTPLNHRTRCRAACSSDRGTKLAVRAFTCVHVRSAPRLCRQTVVQWGSVGGLSSGACFAELRARPRMASIPRVLSRGYRQMRRAP